MLSGQNQRGFTIVELLIVIVVIAILVAVTIVAYSGVQSRARDNIRYQDAKAIINALELYKIDNGKYPNMPATAAGATGCSAGGYNFSWAQDGTWLKLLVDGKYLPRVLLPPINDCSHFYSYIYRAASNYGCTTRTSNYYILQIVGTDGTMTPSDSTSYFKPCPETTVAWGSSASTWAFAKDDD
ncbi:hypothetical protein RAAC3_TM7C00001G0689 [Candidatus Saccharibacteria bacterium RAAC3_TM7_1]|nr:hypothetical protein RAAC3_TM7C00001G0689 [Candidatus Saccharibacteria bacterium RAAC3_TM7_1]HCZ28598.1 prepilin-type N-terminal cleavage/methylation domain-containing protein [Candidatus Saccharibacteria bacterium]